MPELPEVETVVRGIAPHLKKRRITQVELRRADLRVPFPKGFKERLEGAGITGISRRAKYILIELDTAETLVIHLGMSGSLMFREAPFKKHDHVIFTLDNGKKLIFHDPRRFGLMDLVKDTKTHKLFAHLGVEPLAEGFNSVTLGASLKTRSGPIKTAIMDQKVVVGVGNIYASESLFQAHISPLRKANSLKKSEISALCEGIKNVLELAIKSGGSSIKDFVQSSGKPGYFQHSFEVYGHTNKPCLCAAKHGILKITPLVKKITQQGRATYYCNNCQK
jgi:formamidopyrimidine-DNA glycosylase